jgi:DNA primase
MNRDLTFDKGLIECIKQSVDPESVASSLGILFNKESGKTLRASCPIHSGDNKTAFSLNRETGNWRCYTHMCHEGHSDIIGLVQCVRGVDFVQAVQYLAAMAGIDLNSDSDNIATQALRKKDVFDFIKRTTKNEVEMDLCTIYNIEEVVAEWVRSRPSYFYDRGYRQDIQDYFEIGGHVDRFGIPRACFPIRDEDGKVVAYDGRRIDSDEEPRYFMQPDGFRKGSVLYHYHLAKSYVSSLGGVIYIVEGYKACWSMVQLGYFNTVACMGAGIQGGQANVLLRNMGLKKIYLCMDGDIAGRNGAVRTKREFNHLCDTKIIDMPDGHDPSTLGANDLQQIILSQG